MIRYTSKKTESLLNRLGEMDVLIKIDEDSQYLYFTRHRDNVFSLSEIENPQNLLTEDEFISILRYG